MHRHGGGARGFLAPPSLPLVATARDAVGYDFTGDSNRDSCTVVKASYGNVEARPPRRGCHCKLQETVGHLGACRVGRKLGARRGWGPRLAPWSLYASSIGGKCRERPVTGVMHR